MSRTLWGNQVASHCASVGGVGGSENVAGPDDTLSILSTNKHEVRIRTPHAWMHADCEVLLARIIHDQWSEGKWTPFWMSRRLLCGN